MRVVVTGAAGFIGAQVAAAMVRAGHDVLAVDAPDRSASPAAARSRWAALAGVGLLDVDLATADLSPLAEADVIVHLAGRPGVRTSFGRGRADVLRDNVTATRRLVHACAAARELVGAAGSGDADGPRIVFASSSSVYGSAAGRPHREDDALRPGSPYAESKAAAERLVLGSGLHAVVLRYFSVYGPGQRPDMAFHRFAEAVLDGRPLPVFGDGRQARSFTHVSDVVAATVAAATADLTPGTVLNIGHHDSTELGEAIGILAGLLGVRPRISTRAPAAGDAARTWADTTRAHHLLGWTARTPLTDGLADQLAWHLETRESRPA